MAPIDNHQMAMVPAAAMQGANTIPLSTLIDYIVQRTYHELTVLSELLPRKTDMERKIEIVQFASRTRQLFVRLLGLVKWANSAGKVDKCGAISAFLDQQAMLFVDTADMFSKMARETLVHGRLPNFSLPCAIDVLTTGTYPRLPTCVRERIVPPDPITPSEKWQTLRRLGQIIQHRLVTSDLPPQLSRLKIENGRVKFHVNHEFEVTLTLMGDGPTIPWRLLDIDILVEDHETGDGKALVHSLQVHFIHQLVQSRLLESDKPLHDMYNCLHSFCQSLQLEVLHSQAQRLLRERLGEYVRIDDYSAGRSLVLSYWRDMGKNRDVKPFEQVPKVHKLQVHMDDHDPTKPLQATHVPSLLEEDSVRVNKAIKSDHLSIEKLLIQTIEVRSQTRLKDLLKDFKDLIDGTCEIKEIPCVMYVPFLQPVVSSEMLRVAVDIQRGTYLASIGQYPDCPYALDIEDCLNTDKRELPGLVTQLRLWLAIRRCEKAVQHLPATCSETLPITSMEHGHPLERLGRSKLFVRLGKQTEYYVVVEASQGENKSVTFRYFLLEVHPTLFEGAQGENLDTLPQMYLRAGHMVEMDTYALTHGPYTKIQEDVESPRNSLVLRKRKLYLGGAGEPHVKQMKFTSCFVPELTHILALCEERIPFIALTNELGNKGLSHQGIQVDGEGACLALTLLDMPACPDIDLSTSRKLRRNLLSCKFRVQRKGIRVWMVELIFSSSPILSTNFKEQGAVHRVYLQYELTGSDNLNKVVQDFQDDWTAISHLYGVVTEFADILKDSKSGLANLIEIKSYTFKRIVIGYGPNKSHTVSIQWKSGDNQFQLSFGTHGPVPISSNCHSMVTMHHQDDFNHHRSVAQLVQVLSDTVAPLTAISKLSSVPMLGLGPKLNQPVPSFTVIPQSPNHIRIAFRNCYCIDVHCRGSKIVSIRDGAYSLFDTSKVVEGFGPTPGLKSFLSMFVDETVTAALARRRSTVEDDNPPSPIGMDAIDFMPQPHLGSPASRKFHSPMTPPSNPHTPASPASSTRISQGYANSPAAAGFPLSSPPSMAGVAPTPSPAMMGTPSPGNILTSGSPGTANLHVPSPGFVPTPSPQMYHMPSPANTFMNPPSHGGMAESGSPYPSSNLTMPSPGQRTWPGSPASVPHPSPASKYNAMSPGGHPALHSPLNPQMKEGENVRPPFSIPSHQTSSRVLPQRSWAASFPTLLSHDALNKILSPAMPPAGAGTGLPICCPLEKFMGCVFMRRHIQRAIQTEDGLLSLPCNEPGIIMFKGESLQFRASLNTNTLQMLNFKVSPMPEFKEQWSTDEMHVIEKFFEIRVVCPPYKINALSAFCRLLAAPFRTLKDCVQLLRLELVPDRSFKWTLQWCLTISPASTLVAPPGTAAILTKMNKILIMIQLTRLGGPMMQTGEAQSVIVPILYDTNTNTTTLAEHRTVQAQPPANQAISNMLKRFSEFNAKPNECSLFPSVRELLANLIIPM